ncbi:SGNH/GDSL hydrolase family protein [Arthrobacter sp. MDT1-65]
MLQGDTIHRTRHRRFRAAMTMGASLAAGILLMATAADGGGTGSPSARTATSPTVSADPSPTAQAATAAPAASASPTVAVVPPPAPEPPPAPCIDPISRGPGLELPDPGRTALLIGDSQSSGAAGVAADRTWTQAALRGVGYHVRFVGAGGTGFVAMNDSGATNYPSALLQGQWVLPCVDPALIVVQGGGNDAALGATDEQIIGGADAVVSTLSRTYVSSKIVMIGTLATGVAHGGGRRAEVDGVLGAFAMSRSLVFISPGDWLTRFQAGAEMADTVHLTQAGHDRLAGVLATQLQDMQLTPRGLTSVHQTPPDAQP